MTYEAISLLRRRMIDDMTIRQFGGKTQCNYIRQVREFTIFLDRSPDRAEPEDLPRDQLYLASCGTSYARMKLAATALRFFLHTTLGRTGFGDRMARIPTPDRLPVVLSPEEVALLLAHAPGLKYRAALTRHRLSRGQLTVIGTSRAFRTAVLGGHVARCEGCDHSRIAYNSCRRPSKPLRMSVCPVPYAAWLDV